MEISDKNLYKDYYVYADKRDFGKFTVNYTSNDEVDRDSISQKYFDCPFGVRTEGKSITIDGILTGVAILAIKNTETFHIPKYELKGKGKEKVEDDEIESHDYITEGKSNAIFGCGIDDDLTRDEINNLLQVFHKNENFDYLIVHVNKAIKIDEDTSKTYQKTEEIIQKILKNSNGSYHELFVPQLESTRNIRLPHEGRVHLEIKKDGEINVWAPEILRQIENGQSDFQVSFRHEEIQPQYTPKESEEWEEEEFQSILQAIANMEEKVRNQNLADEEDDNLKNVIINPTSEEELRKCKDIKNTLMGSITYKSKAADDDMEEILKQIEEMELREVQRKEEQEIMEQMQKMQAYYNDMLSKK